MQNTCNPFTVTAYQVPEGTYIITENVNKIVENFSYDRPSKSIYKIVGAGGTGKTVILRMVEEKLKGMCNGESGWLFFDINANGDILKQISERFAEEGVIYLPEKGRMFWDICVEVEGMLRQVQQKKILIAIDDVSKSPQMVKFISEYGRWLRAGYPVYFICASLVIALLMIAFVLFYDRSQIHIGTILYQLVYSFCVDLFADAHVYSRYAWMNVFIMVSGVILFAIGTGFYAAASMGRSAYEALTFSLAEKNNWQVKIVRMILDIVMVIIGVALGGKFGICTIVTIIVSGQVIQYTASKTKKLLKL